MKSSKDNLFITYTKAFLGIVLFLLAMVIVAEALKLNNQVLRQKNDTDKQIQTVVSKIKDASDSDGTELPDNNKLNNTFTLFLNDSFNHNHTSKDTKYGTSRSYQAISSVFDGGDPDGEQASYTVKNSNLKFSQSATGWSGFGTIDITEKSGSSDYQISYIANVSLVQDASNNLRVTDVQLGTIGGDK